MTAWFIGQRVACIHDGDWKNISPGAEIGPCRNPRYLEVLTISRIAPWPFGLDPGAPPDTVALTFLEHTADDFAS